jgi:hypothetical protein
LAKFFSRDFLILSQLATCRYWKLGRYFGIAARKLPHSLKKSNYKLSCNRLFVGFHAFMKSNKSVYHKILILKKALFFFVNFLAILSQK